MSRIRNTIVGLGVIAFSLSSVSPVGATSSVGTLLRTYSAWTSGGSWESMGVTDSVATRDLSAAYVVRGGPMQKITFGATDGSTSVIDVPMPSGSTSITDVEMDVEGFIWVANLSDGRIYRFNPTTDPLVTSPTYASFTFATRSMTPRTGGGVYFIDTQNDAIYSATYFDGVITVSLVTATIPGGVTPQEIIVDNAGTGLWLSTTSTVNAMKIIHIDLSGNLLTSCDFSSLYSTTASDWTSPLTNFIRVGHWIYASGTGNSFIWSIDETELTASTTCSTSVLHRYSVGVTISHLHVLPNNRLIGLAGYGYFIDFGILTNQAVTTSTQSNIFGAADLTKGMVRSAVLGPAGTLWYGSSNWYEYYEIYTGLAPVNTVVPSFTGLPEVGTDLVASAGTWLYQATDSGAQTHYQWQRCTDSVCTDITDATNATYRLTPSEFGHTARVKVTAENSAGSAIAYSGETSLMFGVTSAPRTPTLTQTGSRKLKVAWTVPENLNGSDIMEYKVVLGGVTKNTTNLNYSFSSLHAWESYSAKIYALNEAGYSVYAATSSVKPKYYVSKKSKTKLTSIITPKKTSGAKWSESGSCSIKSGKLVAPNKATNCTLKVKAGGVTRTAVVKVS